MVLGDARKLRRPDRTWRLQVIGSLGRSLVSTTSLAAKRFRSPRPSEAVAGLQCRSRRAAHQPHFSPEALGLAALLPRIERQFAALSLPPCRRAESSAWPGFRASEGSTLRHRQDPGRLAHQQLAVGAPRRSVFGCHELCTMSFLPTLHVLHRDRGFSRPSPDFSGRFDTKVTESSAPCRRRRTSAGSARAAASGRGVRVAHRGGGDRPPFRTKRVSRRKCRLPDHQVGELAFLDGSDFARDAV